MDWSYFDATLVLTTTTQDAGDRQALQDHLVEAGLGHAVLCPVAPRLGSNTARPENTLLDIIRYTDNTTTSVTREVASNHMKLIRRALDSNAERVLVMEDDVRFDVASTRKWLPHILGWMRKHPDWVAFNFGAIAFPYFPVAKGVASVRRPLLMHAYAMTRNGMVLALQAYARTPEKHLEITMTAAMPWHVAMPPIAFQARAPAMFTQAIEKLPARVSAAIKTMPFRKFCLLYFETSHLVMPMFVVLVVVFVGVFCWPRVAQRCRQQWPPLA